MRQRLAFAAALLPSPRVIVLDEPMVGLDPQSARRVKRLVREAAAGGACVFMSTHTLSMAEEIADRIGIIRRGRMARCGTLPELRREFGGERSLEDYFLEVTAESAP
jgi:ABC-2 type transport system ATP-binding protein